MLKIFHHGKASHCYSKLDIIIPSTVAASWEVPSFPSGTSLSPHSLFPSTLLYTFCCYELSVVSSLPLYRSFLSAINMLAFPPVSSNQPALNPHLSPAPLFIPLVLAHSQTSLIVFHLLFNSLQIGFCLHCKT